MEQASRAQEAEQARQGAIEVEQVENGVGQDQVAGRQVKPVAEEGGLDPLNLEARARPALERSPLGGLRPFPPVLRSERLQAAAGDGAAAGSRFEGEVLGPPQNLGFQKALDHRPDPGADLQQAERLSGCARTKPRRHFTPDVRVQRAVVEATSWRRGSGRKSSAGPLRAALAPGFASQAGDQGQDQQHFIRLGGEFRRCRVSRRGSRPRS